MQKRRYVFSQETVHGEVAVRIPFKILSPAQLEQEKMTKRKTIPRRRRGFGSLSKASSSCWRR